ncbi:Thymidylate kinase [Prochlorococcus sp. MIT 0601]|nr:Thymidylate kinase [Prochlorococcus sp. MIT 0601]
MPKNALLHMTREPGGTLLGEKLRSLLLNTSSFESPEALTELLLYAADRAQHISQFIQPKLDKGDWVISDRFAASTLAYQGYGRGLNIDIINTLERIATQDVKPDLTVLLKLSVDNSIQRRAEMKNDRIESAGADFLKKVSKGFAIISQAPNWITIQADQEETLVTKEIQHQLKAFFVCKKKN